MTRGRMLGAAATLLLFVIHGQPALAGFVSNYQASSGLFPNQISPPYTLFDDANPENPTLAGGILTLSTSTNAERIFYSQLAPVVDTSGAFFIEARMRFVSGSTSSPSRAPFSISFTTAPGAGNALFIDRDAVFFNTGSDTAGPKIALDTDGAFHTYRIEHSVGGGLTLRYDDDPLPVLLGTTFSSLDFNGSQERIAWGPGSILSFGTSEWQYFQHNALAVPEPETYALFLAGLGFIAFGARRRRRLK